jgi:hypothetical protein
MGQVSQDSVHHVPSPVDIVNFQCYGKPVIIRVKKKYFNQSMLPAGVTSNQLESVTISPFQEPLQIPISVRSIDTHTRTINTLNTYTQKIFFIFDLFIIRLFIHFVYFLLT